MRSTLYDTVSDRYPRFLRDELLPEVEAIYNIRKDAYSRGIMGLSSGAICSFNAAWQMPDQFSRVISWIGTYTSLQWKKIRPIPMAGQDYPDKVLREPKRNIRVWLQDGSRDMQFGQRSGITETGLLPISAWPMRSSLLAMTSLQLWRGLPQRRSWSGRTAGGTCLALEGLRSRQDSTEFRAGCR